MPWWGWGAIALEIVWAVTMVWILRTTAVPLPPLDTTPRTATVTGITEENDNDLVIVEYTHGDGEVYTAGPADVIHDSWIGKFAPGTQ